jgi:hypothetical protein
MELISKLTKVLLASKIPFSSDEGIFELHIGSLPVCIQIEDEDFIQYFIKQDDENGYDFFNETLSSEEISEEDLENIISTLKEVNTDLLKRLRKIESLLEKIKELVDEDESITANFIKDELWEKMF